MDLSVHRVQMQNHQQTAQKLLDRSATLKQLFQDQWFYVWSFSPENMFVIDQDQKKLSIADGLLDVVFSQQSGQIIQFSTPHTDISVQKIADFIFNDIDFVTADYKSFNSLSLQSKVQLFRQLVVEEVFGWVDGENRVEQFLYNLNENEAHQIDQLMIDAGYYSAYHLQQYAASGIAIPLSVELNFKHLSLVNSVLGDNFLSIQKLMPMYEKLCFAAAKFIPSTLYRIIEIIMPERFCLADVLSHQNNFELLMIHAEQNPKLLAFTQRMRRGYWNYRDLLSKDVFLNSNSVYWDDSVHYQHQQEDADQDDDLIERIQPRFPVCYFKRTVNWLFKQDQRVIDWIAQHFKNPNVRITLAALSFLDTRLYHPHVILLTFKYFKPIAARFFVQSCNQAAEQQHWFELKKSKAINSSQTGLEAHVQLDAPRSSSNEIHIDEAKSEVISDLTVISAEASLLEVEGINTSIASHDAALKTNDAQTEIAKDAYHALVVTKSRPSLESKPMPSAIPPSILYVEEWLNALQQVNKDQPYTAKHVFKHLNRVMQAYMQFLQQKILEIPEELIDYIEPEAQENPFFFHSLKRHHLTAADFRAYFKLSHERMHHRMSVFDRYVADYLVDVFSRNKVIAKNVTWQGFFQQAVKWHQEVYFQETLIHLKKRTSIEVWPRISMQAVYHTEQWTYTELCNIEDIIYESLNYKHCLALSYTELIAAGQYVAFHMSNTQVQRSHLTLGCFYRAGQLVFDQLRLPNNEQPNEDMLHDAKYFVQQLNSDLRLKS